MLFHLYKSRLKCLFKNKENIFWSYLFPVALAALFYFAFTNVYSSSDLKTINIAFVQDVEDENATNLMKEVLEGAKISDDLPLFNVKYSDIQEASKALEEDEIIAYIVSGEEAKVYVKNNGLKQTIVKSFMDSYKRAAYTIQSILIKNPAAISQGLLDDVMDYKSYTTEVKKDAEPDVVLIYFYSLLAMCCLMAANWGLEEVTNIQGNRSSRGARINVSPIHKMKLLLINMLAAFTSHAGSIVLVILFMKKVLGISFGNNLPHLILACIVGSLLGLFIGVTVGVWVNKSSGVQGAITTSIIMFGAFLSGMMFVDMKYLVAKKVPILQYINPVNLVSDSFYSLYYYDDFNRFNLNITILLIMTVILCVVSYLGLRRRTYASI
ncbi:MAG: ABC transporter permease [Clostridiales bacterium]|nr:ABC transporter permease [Clostridiales bacterium]